MQKSPWYFTIVVILSMIFGLIGMTMILYFRPTATDNPSLIGVLFAAIVSVLSLLKGQETLEKTQDTHNMVDGQMEAFKRALEEKGILDRTTSLNVGYRKGREALALEQAVGAPAAPAAAEKIIRETRRDE